MLEEETFYLFLRKITAFIWTYAVTNPGVNTLRTPVYTEMVNLVNGGDVKFDSFKFPYLQTKNQLENYNFYNGRPITRSMLAWWAMQQNDQKRPDVNSVFEIEHIYARNRNEMEHTLTDKKSVELLGNKAILEKRINIRASDYRFSDKKKYYLGYIDNKGEQKEKTINEELVALANSQTDFTETDIKQRTNNILNAFCAYLKEEDLLID